MHLMIDDFKTSKFKKWLKGAGVEVMATTNPYEVVRFKHGEVIHVVYKKNNGVMNYSSEDCLEIVRSYLTGKPIPNKVRRVKTRGKTPQQRNHLVKTLLERDGDLCFFCLEPLGEDV